MEKNKELEIEWYRKKVVPVYKEIVDIKLTREAMERMAKAKKEGTDVPRLLQ